MIYFLALIPATALCIAGYFALYLADRSTGAFQKLGKYLGFWAFTLAGLVVLGAIFAAAHGGRCGDMREMHGMCGMHGMHGMCDVHERMHGGWPGESQPEATPPAPASEPNPAAPPR